MLWCEFKKPMFPIQLDRVSLYLTRACVSAHNKKIEVGVAFR